MEQEHISEHIGEQVEEECVEAGSLMPRERVQQRTVHQIVDVPVPKYSQLKLKECVFLARYHHGAP